MSKLSDALATTRPPHIGGTCGVALLIPQLDPESAKDLLQLIAGDQVTAETLATTLRTLGHDIAGQTIARHRRGACKCERTL